MMRSVSAFKEVFACVRRLPQFAAATRPVALAALLFVASGGGKLLAAPLFLTQQPPDLTSAFINVNYNAGTGMFTANGFPTGLSLPPGYAVTPGALSLNMAVNQATGNLISGTLSITGTVPGAGLLSGTLLTGNISDFGFANGGGEIFEFLVDVTGGDLAGAFGSQAGMILDANDSGFNGSFQGNFGNTQYQGVSDTFAQPIPEPASVLVWLCVLVVGGWGLVLMRNKLLPTPDAVHLV